MDTLAYKIVMFANPFLSPGWTVMRAFRGSFTHAIGKDRALTAHKFFKRQGRSFIMASLCKVLAVPRKGHAPAKPKNPNPIDP